MGLGVAQVRRGYGRYFVHPMQKYLILGMTTEEDVANKKGTEEEQKHYINKKKFL